MEEFFSTATWTMRIVGFYLILKAIGAASAMFMQIKLYFSYQDEVNRIVAALCKPYDPNNKAK